MQLNLNANPAIFTTDQAKVSFVGSFLDGSALSWFTPLLERNDPLLHNYQQFIESLKTMFGDPDEKRRAADDLRKLFQTGSATDYAAKFQLLAAKLEYNDAALIQLYRNGLRDDVLDHLLNHPEPSSLSELISWSITSDNILFQRRREKASRQQRTVFKQLPKPFVYPTEPVAEDAGPTPMELNSLQQLSHQPASQVVRRYRLDNNLCLYCGKPGHQLRTCPKKQNKEQRVMALIDQSLDSGNGPTSPVERE